MKVFMILFALAASKFLSDVWLARGPAAIPVRARRNAKIGRH